VAVSELFHLRELDIPERCCVSRSVSLGSESLLSVHDAERGQLSIVDMRARATAPLLRLPVKTAGCTCMHPALPIIFVSSDARCQVFDVTGRAKLGSCSVGSPVEYAAWVDEEHMVLVTDAAVFQWRVRNVHSSPFFDRHSNLRGSQIVACHMSPSQKWCAVVGLMRRPDQAHVSGLLQLYSVEKHSSQFLEAHACAFASLPVGKTVAELFLFVSVQPNGKGKLFCMELGGEGLYGKKACEINTPSDAQGDFPVALHVSAQGSLVYILTKYGFLYLFHLATLKFLHAARVSSSTMVASRLDSEYDGLVGVARNGQFMLVSVDRVRLAYTAASSSSAPATSATASPAPAAAPSAALAAVSPPPAAAAATSLAPVGVDTGTSKEAPLSGARSGAASEKDMLRIQFQEHLRCGRYTEAVALTNSSSGVGLRTIESIRFVQRLPTPPKERSPLLQYFSALMEHGALNDVESMEIVRAFLAAGGRAQVENLLKANKLLCTEELGDLTRTYDARMALSIYYRAKCPEKVVTLMIDSGQIDRVVPYLKEANAVIALLPFVERMLPVDEHSATLLAYAATHAVGGTLIEYQPLLQAYFSRGMVQSAVSVFLDLLAGNRPEDGPLQTLILEEALRRSPDTARAVLQSRSWTAYDMTRVARLAAEVKVSV
jgi:clathrin heavy chain